MATYNLKLNFHWKLRSNRCRWRHGCCWQPIGSHQHPIWWYHCRLPTIYRSATIPHDWHTIVRYDFSRSSKVNDLHVIWKPICDFLLVINSNLSPISHRLATIHPWQTDGQTATTMPIARLLVKYGQLKKQTNKQNNKLRYNAENKPCRRAQ